MKTLRECLLSITILMSLAVTANAGHAVPGGAFCEPCGTPTCVCDPGEGRGGNVASTEPIKEADMGSLALLFFVSVFVLGIRLKS
jgi:hypothetical protein